MKLAEALLRRKELQAQVDRLDKLKESDFAEFRLQRVNVSDGVDEIKAMVPKISIQQSTHAYDWHSKQLRKIDAAIQQANWNTEIEVDAEVNADYVDPYVSDLPETNAA